MASYFRAGWVALALWLTGCASVGTEDKASRFNEVGLADFDQGRFDKARECFAMALELTPGDPHLLVNLAQCHDREGHTKLAEQYYVLCLQKAPANVEARYALVMLYYRTGDRARAAALVDQWFKQQPGSAEPYALEGWRLRREGDLPGARDILLKAMARDPGNFHVMTELAIVYEMLDAPQRALSLYETSLVRNPNQPEVIQRLRQLKSSNVGRPQPD